MDNFFDASYGRVRIAFVLICTYLYLFTLICTYLHLFVLICTYAVVHFQ
jgi:hypothetical protein